MSAPKVKPYTRAMFEADMRSMGWQPKSFLGYWALMRNGQDILHVCEHNYDDLRTAIRAFRAEMRKCDRKVQP